MRRKGSNPGVWRHAGRGQPFCLSRTELGMRLVGSESSHTGTVAAPEATG